MGNADEIQAEIQAELQSVRTRLRAVYSSAPSEAQRTIDLNGKPFVRPLSNSVRDEWRRKTYAELKQLEKELQEKLATA